MNQQLETDAIVEPEVNTLPTGTNANISFKSPDGGAYFIQTTGRAPHLQVGNNNVMYVSNTTGGAKKRQRRAKKPLIQSTDIPGTNAIHIVANNIGREWRKLGRVMNFTDGEMDNIKMSYSPEGQYEINYQMLLSAVRQYQPVHATFRQRHQKNAINTVGFLLS